MQTINDAVEKHSKMILDAERYIWQNPETGYKEYKTSAYMKEQFEKLGYDLEMADGITGFYTVFDTGKEGPEILVLAELDSIICPAHPECDKETGAVHSCGHNAQCAALLGVAAALREEGVAESLCGRIRLCAVPAEELLEIEYRTELKKKGTIRYMGGKSEFMYRGYFDGVDMAFMIHTASSYGVKGGSVGCLAKKITYKGKASHAGGSPWNGINALYAANCGLNAINAIRETFKESDIIRVHPIITSGGAMVNAIPAEATLESYVRGSSFDAIKEANKKVNRAICGGALSVGANVEIEDIPGYAPLNNCPEMIDVFKEAVETMVPDYDFWYDEKMGSGSTDMGDLCCVMPVVHPYSGGAKGNAHGSDYYIENPKAACVDCAKVQLYMLKTLLSDEGRRAKEIISEYKPLFGSFKEYFEFMDSLERNGDCIEYTEDEARVRL